MFAVGLPVVLPSVTVCAVVAAPAVFAGPAADAMATAIAAPATPAVSSDTIPRGRTCTSASLPTRQELFQAPPGDPAVDPRSRGGSWTRVAAARRGRLLSSKALVDLRRWRSSWRMAWRSPTRVLGTGRHSFLSMVRQKTAACGGRSSRPLPTSSPSSLGMRREQASAMNARVEPPPAGLLQRQRKRAVRYAR